MSNVYSNKHANLDYSQLINDLRSFKEVLLSNLILVAEQPASVGATKDRANIIVNRLSDTESLGAILDSAGNVIAEYPAVHPKRNIVLHAHIDTHHSSDKDHTIQVFSDKVIGLGLVDNSLGIATLLTLPSILEKFQFNLETNIVFCFSANSLDEGNLHGTQHFLETTKRTFHYGICVEGFPLGRISYHSLGLLRGIINYAMPSKYDWSRFESSNSIINIVNIINRILGIPLPNKPRTSIQFSRLQSGISYDVLPSSAQLHFQVRSESDEIVEKIKTEIDSILSELALSTGATANLDIITKRFSGGLPFSHPLVTQLHAIQNTLNIKTALMASTSDLCAYIERGIPAVTIGLSSCENYNLENEVLHIEPIFTGIAQLLGLILAIDRGKIEAEKG